MVWTKEGLNAREITSPELDGFNQAVGISVMVEDEEQKRRPLDIFVIYRPHKLYTDNKNSLSENDMKLNSLMLGKKNPTIWLGDFNMKDIDWNLMTGKNNNEKNFIGNPRCLPEAICGFPHTRQINLGPSVFK